MSAHEAGAVLSVRSLTVDLEGADRQVGLIENVSFDVFRNRTLALIGESGCGKTMTAMAILRLLPPGVRVSDGEVCFQGTDLLSLPAAELRKVRGGGIGTIFQDPMSSLNPTMRIGDQIAEARRLHIDESRDESRRHAIRLLDQVDIPHPERRLDAYPFEMSGGMQQRVMIAMAIACDPAVLIADEPTTALDVTIQAEILELLGQLQADRGMGILLVTHDLGVVADFAEDVVVMYAGHVVERAGVEALFHDPQHPYSVGLLDSMPQGAPPRTELPVVTGRVPLAGEFPTGCRFRTRCRHALDGVCDDPDIEIAETRPLQYSQCVRVQNGSVELSGRGTERRLTDV